MINKHQELRNIQHKLIEQSTELYEFASESNSRDDCIKKFNKLQKTVESLLLLVIDQEPFTK